MNFTQAVGKHTGSASDFEGTARSVCQECPPKCPFLPLVIAPRPPAAIVTTAATSTVNSKVCSETFLVSRAFPRANLKYAQTGVIAHPSSHAFRILAICEPQHWFQSCVPTFHLNGSRGGLMCTKRAVGGAVKCKTPPRDLQITGGGYLGAQEAGGKLGNHGIGSLGFTLPLLPPRRGFRDSAFNPRKPTQKPHSSLVLSSVCVTCD